MHGRASGVNAQSTVVTLDGSIPKKLNLSVFFRLCLQRCTYVGPLSKTLIVVWSKDAVQQLTLYSYTAFVVLYDWESEDLVHTLVLVYTSMSTRLCDSISVEIICTMS